MEIKVAKYCGFCYGVKRAVELAQKAASEHVNGATLGPLIHNPQLIAELAAQGIACKDSLEQFAPGETVIFRSHGVGPEVYEQAEDALLLDTSDMSIAQVTDKILQLVQERV